MERSLESFLDSERQLGQLDSSGTFTLDAHRSRLKLAQFQLAKRSYWVLKLVQAAVGAGADQVEITLGRDVDWVRFEPNQKCELEQLIGHIQQPEGRPGWLGDFATGINAVLSDQPRAVLVGSPDWHLRLADGHLQVYPGTSSAVPGWTVAVRSRGGVLAWVGGDSRRRAELAEAINTRCCYCPVPILLDHRVLLRGELNPDWATHPRGLRGKELSRLFYLAQAHLGEDNRLARLRPTAAMPDGGIGVRHCDSLYFREAFSDLCAFLAVPLGLRGPGRVDFVQAGVVVDRHHLDLGVEGAQVVVDSPGLSVDLSHFQLVENAAYQALVARLCEEVRLLVEVASSHLHLLGQDSFNLEKYVRFRLALLKEPRS